MDILKAKIKHARENFEKFNSIEKLTELVNSDSFDEFSELCDFLETTPYSPISDLLKESEIDRKSMRCIENMCNERVNSILGSDLAYLYYKLVESICIRQWDGDDRYKLFSHSNYNSDTRRILKTAMYLSFNVFGNPVESIYVLKGLVRAYTDGLDPEFGIFTKAEEQNSEWEFISKKLFEIGPKEAFEELDEIVKQDDNAQFGVDFL